MGSFNSTMIVATNSSMPANTQQQVFSRAWLAVTVLITQLIVFQPCFAQIIEFAPVIRTELADERPAMYGLGIGLHHLDTSSGIWLGLSVSYMGGNRIGLIEYLDVSDVDKQLGMIFGGTRSISGKWKLKGGIHANYRSMTRSVFGALPEGSSYYAQGIASGLTVQLRYKLGSDASVFFGAEPGYLFLVDQKNIDKESTAQLPLRNGMYIGFHFGFAIKLNRDDWSDPSSTSN